MAVVIVVVVVIVVIVVVVVVVVSLQVRGLSVRAYLKRYVTRYQ